MKKSDWDRYDELELQRMFSRQKIALVGLIGLIIILTGLLLWPVSIKAMSSCDSGYWDVDYRSSLINGSWQNSTLVIDKIDGVTCKGYVSLNLPLIVLVGSSL